MQPEAVDAQEAARLAGISRAKLYPYLTDGTLPSIKLGKRRLIRVTALREWLANLERSAA